MMSRARHAILFSFLGFLLSVFYFLFSGFFALASGTESESILDPLRIQRILIPRDRVLAELERVKQGTLIQMSRKEFEDLAQRATQRLDALKNPPRLIEARYEATLTRTALVGTGRWRIVNPTSVPTIVPLRPWNLALVKARWSKGQGEFDPALIADWKGQGLGLLVDQPGERTVVLDWTVRGDPGPAGLHFEIEAPASPLATLELNLPSDQAVVSESDAYLVSGPLPSNQEGASLWRIEFAGQTKLDLMIRPRPDEPATPLVLSQISSRHDVRPDFVQVDFEVKVEIARQPIQRPLLFEIDPALQPVEVSASDLESWELPSPSRLQVRWRRPFQGGVLQIRCLAPMTTNQVWQPSRLQLEGAVQRGETIVLRVPPDMQIKSWQPGAFHLADNEITSDGGQILTLTGIELSPDAGHQRPRVEFQTMTPNYRVRQLAWWQIALSGSTLNEQLVYEVTKGHLHQIQLRVPTGWEVEKSELVPTDLARTQTIVPGNSGTVLSIDLQRPLVGGVVPPARLNVVLRPVQPELVSELAVPFPDLVPIGAGFRESSLAISVDPLLQAQVVNARTEPAENEKGPWGKQAPDFFFSYRGPAILGLLELKARHLQFQAQATSEVTTGVDRTSQVTRLVLKPQDGKPRSLFVHFSAPLPKKWVWRTTVGRGEVQTARRLSTGEVQALLACLAAPYSLPAATLFPWTLHGELWQLILDRPLQGPLTLEATFDLLGHMAGGRSTTRPKPINHAELENDGMVLWEIPLPVVLQAGVLAGKVIVNSNPAVQIHMESAGLTPEQDQPTDFENKKSFRYESNPRTLILRGQRGPADRAIQPILADQVQLDTQVESQGRQIYRLAFEISGWPQKSLPIRLPPGARPVNALIAGKSVGHLQWEEENGLVQVLLPVPSGGDRYSVELMYEIENPNWIFWSEISMAVPELPLAEPPVFVRTCRLPPGVAPMTDSLWRGGGSSTLPNRLALDDSSQGWTSWTFQGQKEMGVKMRLVRPGAFLAIGYGAGLVLLLAGWRYWLANALWFLITSAAATALFLLLPSGLRGLALGPILALLVLATKALFELIRTRSWSKTAAKAATATVLAILILLGSTRITAQVSPFRLTPKPTLPPIPVYLIPGPENDPERQSVLLAPEAVEKLRIQAGEIAGSPLLLDSRYDGKVVDTHAEFRAEWTAFNPGEEPARLVIPLGGVKLEEARLDGAPAQPVHVTDGEAGAHKPQNGALAREAYAIDLKGKGAHSVQFRFVATVQGAGEVRDLQIRIPELTQNRLTFTAPAGAEFLYAPGSRGRQLVTPLGDSKAVKGLRLETDLGQTNSIHVRWRQAAANSTGAAKEAPTLLDIREAYLWDLRPAGSSLFAVHHCTVNQGAVSSLEITLPDPLEVRHDPSVSQAVRPGEPQARLKEWRVIGAGKDRRLHLEFQRPVSGKLQISFELVPRIPLGSVVELPLPSPFGDNVARQPMADSVSFLAFRTENLQAQIANHLRITGVEANDFREFWVAAGMPDPGPETHAFSFQRNPGSPPVLRLQLDGSHGTSGANHDPGRTVLQDIHWLVKPGQADFTAKIRLAAPTRELALVECDLPPSVNLIDVTGPEVHSWSQSAAASGASDRPGSSNSRLQIWLKGMFADTTLELTGWLSTPRQQTPQQTDDHFLFTLVPIHLLSAANQHISIQVETRPGWDLKLKSRKNIWPPPSPVPARPAPSPTGEPAALEEFITNNSNYEAAFELFHTAGSIPTSSLKPSAKE
jgi:hypothetical protein